MRCLLFLVLVCSVVLVFSEDCKPGTCKSYETCCPTGLPGDYSCCPYSNAVCCADHTFCCPEDTECDIIEGKCRTKGRRESKLQDFERRQGVSGEASIAGCKPGTCDFDETCCPTAIPGHYNCCPYRNAVCCEDHRFCCQEDAECDILEGKCVPKEEAVVNKLEKRQGPLVEEAKTQCADGSRCSSDNTCCKIMGGKYGCCPHIEATCCPDKIHCCAKGQACDVTSRYCVGKQAMDELSVTDSALPIDFEDLA